MTQFASTLYPKTNPTNPILLEVRTYHDGRMPLVGEVAKAFLKAWDRLFTVNRATPAQRVHAHRVLTRLVSFSG